MRFYLRLRRYPAPCGKQRWADAESAISGAILALQAKHHRPPLKEIAVYQCECGGWHLTRQTEGKKPEHVINRYGQRGIPPRIV